MVYNEDNRSGRFESWFENGTKHLEVKYSENHPNGKWKVWNEEGSIVGEASYNKGKLINGIMFDSMGHTMASR